MFRKGYILTAPKKEKKGEYTTALLRRYGAAFQNNGVVDSDADATKRAWEYAFQYLDRVVDRQISKASGLLTFNSILLVVLYGQDALFKCREPWRIVLTTLLIVSCFIMLDMLYVNWSDPSNFESAKKDFEGSLDICSSRTRHLFLSLVLSSLAVLIMLFAEYKFACK
ncbi:hypothetical protein [Paraburkholderia sediminicola]|uniref:hypothetical protein n=1 Tax=Paraburkholderia sediminicola TaxID=458836 RepID=UPI0038BBA406